jgi:hypothetical protein
MEQVTIWMAIGFFLAAYSVIANDSVQTLGTWIASNNEKFKWTTLWAGPSCCKRLRSYDDVFMRICNSCYYC